MAPLCSSSCWDIDISSWRPPHTALFLSVEASTPHLVSLLPFLMAGPGTVVWMLSVQHRLMGLSCWFSASGSGSQWTL